MTQDTSDASMALGVMDADALKKAEEKVLKQKARGEDLNPRVAALADSMWNGEKDTQGISAIIKRNNQPANLKIEMIECNEELKPLISSFVMKRDESLKQVQGAIARSAYPLVKLTEEVFKKEPNIKSLGDLCYDTLALLADANSKILKVRRKAVQTQVRYGYRSLCVVHPKTDVSKYLFGPNLSARIKGATDAARLRQNRRFQPYPTRGFRGYGEYYSKLEDQNKKETDFCEIINNDNALSKNFSDNGFRSQRQGTRHVPTQRQGTRKSTQTIGGGVIDIR